MNAAEVDVLRLACEHVEDHRLAAMADVVVAGGTLAAATDAVRTNSYFGALTEAGEIHATSTGLRVRVGDRSQRELSVTWTAVAAALMPALRSDLGVDVVNAYDDTRRADYGRSGAARAFAWHRWRQVKAHVLETAFSTVPVQNTLFDSPIDARRPDGRRQIGPGR